MRLLAIQSYLWARSRAQGIVFNEEEKGHTFTKIADTLAIDRSTVIVDVGHQELTEVLDD